MARLPGHFGVMRARHNESLEDTHVTTDGNGYVVHLYDYRVFGCTHPTSAVDVKVGPLGDISEIARTQVFLKPAMERHCVD